MDMIPQEGRLKGHFHIRISRGAMIAALSGTGHEDHRGAALILEIDTQEARIDGKSQRCGSLPVIPFPFGAIAFIRLMRAPASTNGEEIDLYLPRSGFDRLADTNRTQRMETLTLKAGMAADDHVLAGLEQCLERTLALPAQINALFVNQLASAVQSHVARTYGGMDSTPSTASGGLAPWQLRRVRDLIDSQLTSPIALSALASICNLSISHFSRSFVRSTGLPPHRWIMRRRVDLAQAELRDSNAPLADLALRYGFADQSHFTRVFSATTGKTPGRWRAETQGMHAIA